MDVEMVKAIGNLWTLALVLFLMVRVVVFRKQLQILCERPTKIQFKRGETETSLVQEGKEVAVKPKPLSEEGIASEDKPAAKATDELLRLEPKTANEWEKEMLNALILSRDLQRGGLCTF